MDWSSEYLQSILGQIIGDPTHRLGCRWVEDNGVCCNNPVSKDSRRNGAICLKMFQDLPTGHPPKTRLAEAARMQASHFPTQKVRPKMDEAVICPSQSDGGNHSNPEGWAPVRFAGTTLAN
ncbi:uncharacterized protein N7446_014147 [Penicillium canescens]|uniref:Uncharacterized protein n=1 Tax=Penicillium canescens TaxID=5083 RepID=A0AAD6HYW0_PENCN|nr:uncharacterized protein N7446_014147 [Penicillium canescens]KAJ6022347.1 hypothetical protein N7460_014091 [Penicillium canescens]KAJ6038995.1 hypothetical protein N7446_014147 [Penicillium canescens]KAJ6066235.1 hypothetical protein N7444_000227 [Penicillium canescens]KAJ6174670.1 hypothetical protein N7485_005407 [Penicillium canescens]